MFKSEIQYVSFWKYLALFTTFADDVEYIFITKEMFRRAVSLGHVS